MDLIVKSKFDRENRLSSEKNKLKLIKELNYLSLEDEWALIDNYKKSIYLEEEEKKSWKKNHQNYLDDLDK